jgi:hypothetical protein
MNCNKGLMMTWQYFFIFILILWLISLKNMWNLFLSSVLCFTGGRKRRRNDHPSVWSDTVLSPVTTTISDRGNRYKGWHGLYSPIRKRTSGGDTSL